VGRFFGTFDEAWRFFLERQEDLEDFFEQFPAGDGFLMGWMLPLDAGLAVAVEEAQEAFAGLDWVTPQPRHFLHTWIGGVSFAPRRPTAAEIEVAVKRAQHAWRGMEPFDLGYRRISCFHSAVVVEVEGDGPSRLAGALDATGYWNDLPITGAMAAVELETFLAHLTIGLVNRRIDPSALREKLVQVRETELGHQRVTDVALCVVPASRTTILDPWELVQSVALGRG
jgi:hypothetical protein